MQKKIKILFVLLTLIFPLLGSYGPRFYSKEKWREIRKEVKKTVEEVARQEAAKRARLREKHGRKTPRDTTG